MTRKRAKNLDAGAIKVIVGILDGWAGRLTWAGLVDKIEERLFNRYTRQALDSHEQIKLAFLSRKTSLSPLAPTKRAPVNLEALEQRLARVEAENARLHGENERLLEQFARWAYNAHLNGLDKSTLNQDLPRVDRGQTKRHRYHRTKS